MDTQQMLIAALGAIFTIVGYLLSQRDAKQAKEIELLFKKHDDDAAQLIDLRIKIAENHYQKNELDAKFSDINKTLKEGFTQLDGSIKKLGESFVAHVTEHGRKEGQ